MWKIALCGILLLICVVLLLLLVINGIILAVKSIRHLDKGKAVQNIKRTSVLFVVGMALCAGFIVITQWTASTPPIRDGNGNEAEGSISELISIDLNGRQEWISIRGHNSNDPVLLFLAGGPGGTQMAAVRYELSELEKHFVVVNWTSRVRANPIRLFRGQA